ncbi:MAG: hypothetical protein IPG98_00260 [Burkholderiales bacterium]|nr:hypothetical protein [Burkholderiales bacterium]MBK8665336.1 hypothetical protein [Burkholderiales bacterium]
MTKSVLLLATLLATGAQAACYTVLGPRGEVLLQSSTPPVDMSGQLHQTVPQRFGPGATMVFGIADPDCGPPVDAYYDGAPTPVAYRDGLAQPVRAVRAPRRDRE